MEQEDSGQYQTGTCGAQFTQTHWSMVLLAGQQSSPEGAEALAKLCRTYWFPVYGYLRRKGFSPPDAQDLTQEFFTQLIRKNAVASADRQKGKFRTFVLAVLNNLIADEMAKAHAQKRGGGRLLLSLDAECAEQRYQAEPASDLTPERALDRRWGRALLDEALQRLRKEYEVTGKMKQFELLKEALTGQARTKRYQEAALQLGTSAKHIALLVHRMRHRFGELVRSEVAATVTDPAEVDDELRALFS